MIGIKKGIIRPSWKSGFARNASESKAPHLWVAKEGHWIPSLGITGINTLFDVAGKRKDGTLNSITLADWVMWRNGYGLLHDGASDFAATTCFPNPAKFTFSYWARFDDFGTNRMCSGAHDGSNRFYLGSDDYGTLKIFWGVGDTFRGTSNPSADHGMAAGEDHHLLMTGNGSVAYVFLDNVLLDTMPSYSTSGASILAINIGNTNRSPDVNYMIGLLDDIRYYERILLPQERTQLYENRFIDLELRRRITYFVPLTIINIIDSTRSKDSVSKTNNINALDLLQIQEQESLNILTPIFDMLFGKEIASLSADIPLVDTARGKDTVLASTNINISDLLSTKETLNVEAGISLVDIAKALDSLNINMDVSTTDSLKGKEQIQISTPINILDSMKGKDTITVTATIPIKDLTRALEIIQADATIPITERMEGRDSVLASASVNISDSIEGQETSSINVDVSIQEDSRGEEVIFLTFTKYITDSLTAKEIIDIVIKAIEAIRSLYVSRAKTNFYESPGKTNFYISEKQ